MSITYYTKKEMDKERKSANTYRGIIDRLINNWGNKIREENRNRILKERINANESYYNTPSGESYIFIPSRTEFLREGLNKIYEELFKKIGYKHNINFLELGSGIGINTVLANIIGFKSVGIEYNKEIYDQSIRFANYSTRFINGDFFDYSKEVKTADVIFYYMPVADKEKTRDKFEKWVIKNAKKGAIIISAEFKIKDINKLKDITFENGNYFKYGQCLYVYEKLGKEVKDGKKRIKE